MPYRNPSVVDARAVLGVTPEATPSQVRTAFRRRAKVVHPDVSDATDAAARFAALAATYRVALEAAHSRTNHRADLAMRKRGPVFADFVPSGFPGVPDLRGTAVWESGRPILLVGPVTVHRPAERGSQGRDGRREIL